MPPRASRSASRRVHASSCARDGATPDTPMNEAPGMRTPRSWREVAQPSAISQWTRKGMVMMSRRKPRPGMMAVKAHGWGTMSTNSTSSRSPARAPFTSTGPVSGWIAPASMAAKSASVDRGVRYPSVATRVSSATSSPSSTSTIGGMSGCQRLCPVLGSSRRGRFRSMVTDVPASKSDAPLPLPRARAIPPPRQPPAPFDPHRLPGTA